MSCTRYFWLTFFLSKKFVIDQEFCSEVEVLSCAQHRNVVMLIGFCIEDGRRLLVYEYICHGSLDSHLYGNSITVKHYTNHFIRGFYFTMNIIENTYFCFVQHMWQEFPNQINMHVIWIIYQDSSFTGASLKRVVLTKVLPSAISCVNNIIGSKPFVLPWTKKHKVRGSFMKYNDLWWA